jgi:hypothetical protein
MRESVASDAFAQQLFIIGQKSLHLSRVMDQKLLQAMKEDKHNFYKNHKKINKIISDARRSKRAKSQYSKSSY